LGANAIKGIITFALGGLVLAIDLLLGGNVLTGNSIDLSSVTTGLAVSFIGFLLLGIGLWAMIQDAVASRTSENPR